MKSRLTELAAIFAIVAIVLIVSNSDYRAAVVDDQIREDQIARLRRCEKQFTLDPGWERLLRCMNEHKDHQR